MRKKILVPVLIICAVLVIAVPCIVSYSVVGTANPISSLSGYIRVTSTNAQSVQICDDPIIMISEPDESLLDKFMEAEGYEQIEEDRMGGIYVYSNGTETVHIAYSQNKYYSLWKWID